MLLYFDCCCLNRPFDDQRQPRIEREALAVISLLDGVRCGAWDMVSSEILRLEVAEIADETRRREVMRLLDLSKTFLPLNDQISARAETLRSVGFKSMDALHVAAAEDARATFLTTDDQLLRVSARNIGMLKTRVANPLEADIFVP